MKRKSLHEIKHLCEMAHAKQMLYLVATNGEDNPQVVEMRTKSVAIAETLESVMEAFDGNDIFLRILSE